MATEKRGDRASSVQAEAQRRECFIDLVSRPRELESSELFAFEWQSMRWYGARARWRGREGVAFLPLGLLRALRDIASSPSDELAARGLFLDARVYESEATVLEESLEGAESESSPSVVEVL